MTSETRHDHRSTRRSFLKTIAAGTATAALLATTRVADARPPMFDTGLAPNIGATRKVVRRRTAPTVRTRFERRTPD